MYLHDDHNAINIIIFTRTVSGCIECTGGECVCLWFASLSVKGD